MRDRRRRTPNDQTLLECQGCERIATLRELKGVAIPKPGGIPAKELTCPRCGEASWSKVKEASA